MQIGDKIKQLEGILEEDLPVLERTVEGIQNDLMKALIDKRKEAKKKCLDNFDNLKLNMRDLEDIISKIKQKIKEIDNEEKEFNNKYGY